MADTKSISGALRTRRYNRNSNYSDSYAAQGYSDADQNLVGLINFAGLNLTNKVIQKIVLSMSVDSKYTGQKTVRFFRSTVQGTFGSDRGDAYVGAALGNISRSWSTSNSITLDATHNADMFEAMCAYLAAGNRTIIIYDRNASGSGWSDNYIRFSAVTIKVTYNEGISVPTTDKRSVDIGSSVTISTNRASTDALHTLTYRFGNAAGTIATSVADSTSWTIPSSFSEILSEFLSGECQIICETFYNGVSVGTASTTITVTVPSTDVPTIGNVTIAEATTKPSGVTVYVQGKSRLQVSFTASPSSGAEIVEYYATINGEEFSANSFTTAVLRYPGENTLTVYAIDSRGKIASATRTVTVYQYTIPTIQPGVDMHRCTSEGETDPGGGYFSISNAAASFSELSNQNSVSWSYAVKKTSDEWPDPMQWTAISGDQPWIIQIPNSSPTMSYNIRLRVVDKFGSETFITDSVSTAFITLCFKLGGKAAGFGGYPDAVPDNMMKLFDWGLDVDEDATIGGDLYAASVNPTSPISVEHGGTGATTAAGARENLEITPENIGAAEAEHGHSFSDISGTLDISQGGTGATTAGTALAALGGFAASHLRYGTVDSGSNAPVGTSEYPVQFPIAFPEGVTPIVLLTINYSNTSDIANTQYEVSAVSNTGFTIRFFNGATAGRHVNFAWLAIG